MLMKSDKVIIFLLIKLINKCITNGFSAYGPILVKILKYYR